MLRVMVTDERSCWPSTHWTRRIVLWQRGKAAKPLGFECVSEDEKVLRLSKAFYGLRQAPHAWNIKLDDTLVSLGS